MGEGCSREELQPFLQYSQGNSKKEAKQVKSNLIWYKWYRVLDSLKRDSDNPYSDLNPKPKLFTYAMPQDFLLPKHNDGQVSRNTESSLCL